MTATTCGQAKPVGKVTEADNANIDIRAGSVAPVREGMDGTEAAAEVELE